MYNLLVTAGEGQWNGQVYVFGVGRFLEYTSDALKERFSSLDAEAIAALKQLPTLFAYESGVGELGRVGWITKIQKRNLEVRIAYEFDQAIPPIDPQRIDELVWALDINNYEMNRTHWAVKDVDLLQVLHTAGLLGGEEQSGGGGGRKLVYAFSRQTVINACDVLKTLGHTGFDRFLLELGVDGINAGRDLGSLLARSNALAKFALNHKEILRADGEPLQLAVVRKAAQSDLNYPSGGLHEVGDENRAGFWQDLQRDGYAFQDGRIVAVSAPPAAAIPPYAEPRPTPERAVAASVLEPVSPPFSSPPRTNKVFLVHGRDHGAMHEVARYLERLGLEVVILHERPNGGRTLISKFREESADIGFAVVLMSPDDIGHLRDEDRPTPRARQNVVFELGFFIGKLGPERVCALVAGHLEKPSDFEAVVYVAFGPHTGWRTELARELRAAGVPFDHSKVF